MAGSEPLNDVEQLILIAIARLGDDAYGVSIRSEIRDRAGRKLSTAATYAALERLENRGLVVFRLSEATPRRGGRRKKVYRLTRPGESAVLAAREGLERMWEGVDFTSRRSA